MIQEPNKAKSHLSNTYVVVASCFHSILHLKTQVEGACELNLLLQFLYQYSVNASKHMQKYLKDVSQLFLYAKFQHVLPRKMLGQYFFFAGITNQRYSHLYYLQYNIATLLTVLVQLLTPLTIQLFAQVTIRYYYYHYHYYYFFYYNTNIVTTSYKLQ